jgi:manganese oxidase
MIALCSITFLAGCQTAATDQSAPKPSVIAGTKVTIDIKNSTFTSSAIQITKGTTVTWRNDDYVPHTVTSGTDANADGLFDSQELAQGKEFSYTFNKPGTYHYFCTYHPDMTGTVIVTDSKGTAGQDSMSNMDMSTGNESTASTGSADSEAKATIAPLGTGTADEPMGVDKLRYLPYKVENGYKVFHLTAEPVWWQVKPGEKVQAWAYNGSVPGPIIQVNKGDKVKIEVTNKLTEGTTVHWHGLDVPFAQDGTGGVSQPDIKPGETWTYTFTVAAPPGSYMYHSHPMNDMLKQENMGLFGPFLVEPAGTPWRGVQAGYQEEYTLVLNDSSQFGYTINGLSYPATPVLPAKVGDKVLVHIINTGSMEHPLHLHGMHFQQLNQDGYPLPSPITMDTINTAPGTTYDLSFVADQPGKWLFHCHITSHVTDSNGQMTGMVTMFNVQPK